MKKNKATGTTRNSEASKQQEQQPHIYNKNALPRSFPEALLLSLYSQFKLFGSFQILVYASQFPTSSQFKISRDIIFFLVILQLLL